jgi:SAM-dependent methyltransferase
MDDLSDLIIGHYERHALEWEADRRHTGWNDKPWHDRFVSALRKDATVLDLGCGGGAPVAANMARCGLRITGVDTSPTLISLCRERMPDQKWIVADMRSGGPTYGEAVGSYRGDPLYHASLGPAEYEAQLDRIGFEIVAHAIEDRSAGGRTAWLARSRSKDERQ